jgi:hypothetical protein
MNESPVCGICGQPGPKGHSHRVVLCEYHGHRFRQSKFFECAYDVSSLRERRAVVSAQVSDLYREMFIKDEKTKHEERREWLRGVNKLALSMEPNGTKVRS